MSETPHSVSPDLHGEHHAGHAVHLPASTAWPFLLALGLSLVFASIVTSPWLAILGGSLTLVSAVGWFRNVLPHEAHEDIAAPIEIMSYVPTFDKVSRIQISQEHRTQFPTETFPISSGLIGGIAGGIAMVIPAEIYGVTRFHSIWYVVNLLGGAGVGDWINPTTAEISQFHFTAFVTANIIQGCATLLVGLLYGAMLPIWPKRPILLGGIVAPVLWTGLLHSILGMVNPFFQQRIDWLWFSISQLVFGLVAGFVVTRLGKLKRLVNVPLAIRLGVESPGLHHEHSPESDAHKGDGE